MKRFGLLENGTIEPLYYGNSDEPREVVRESGGWFLYHDEYVLTPNGIMQQLLRHKIVKMADRKVDLLNDLKKIRSSR